VRDGQTSPHKARLVVPHSTCPSLSPSPPAHSFIIGPAVINTVTHTLTKSQSPHDDAPVALTGGWVRPGRCCPSARRRVARGGAPLRQGDGVPWSAPCEARGAREQRRAWRAGAETHDQQQPTTTSLCLTQRQLHVRQQDAPRVFPATRTRWMCAAAIGSHVQNTGFSGGSIETMHWQGEWPGRAGVRRQGSSIKG
jgi:hypothetical protein